MSNNGIDAQTNLIQFIQSHYEPSSFVPLHAPCFDDDEKRLLNECIDSTFVSSVGEFVSRFETQVAEFTGAKHAVAVVNGTMGLFLALKVAGVQPGDLVLTQSLTFVATANAIKMLHADPLFIDVSRETWGMDVQSLAVFLEEETDFNNGQCFHRKTGQRIAACVPMHTLGFPVDIEPMQAMCELYGIALVEDAAESLGSFIGDKHTGTFGKLGVFSFNGNKIITTGGGGMIITDDDALAHHARHLSTTAKIPHAWLFEHDEVAYNFRLPNINAALGVAQMRKLRAFMKEKRTLAMDYSHYLQNQPGLVFFDSSQHYESFHPNYWLNAVVTDNLTERDHLLKIANDSGVQMRPLWTPMHKLEIYRQALTMPLPNTEWIAERAVNLPSGVTCRV